MENNSTVKEKRDFQCYIQSVFVYYCYDTICDRLSLCRSLEWGRELIFEHWTFSPTVQKKIVFAIKKVRFLCSPCSFKEEIIISNLRYICTEIYASEASGNARINYFMAQTAEVLMEQTGVCVEIEANQHLT